jgi:hypothetical protein
MFSDLREAISLGWWMVGTLNASSAWRNARNSSLRPISVPLLGWLRLIEGHPHRRVSLRTPPKMSRLSAPAKKIDPALNAPMNLCRVALLFSETINNVDNGDSSEYAIVRSARWASCGKTSSLKAKSTDFGESSQRVVKSTVARVVMADTGNEGSAVCKIC